MVDEVSECKILKRKAGYTRSREGNFFALRFTMHKPAFAMDHFKWITVRGWGLGRVNAWTCRGVIRRCDRRTYRWI